LNSRGEPSICSGTNDVGFVKMELFEGGFGDEIFMGSGSWFVGFAGLNNGDGTGSMDSWWWEQ